MRRTLAAVLCALVIGCSTEDGSPTGPGGGGTPAQVGQYLQNLPAWSTFAPPRSEQDPAPSGAASLVFDTVPLVRTVLPNDTTVRVDSNVAYICESTPYSVARNPQQIVMYNPNASVLFPGALIQGKSHKDSVGSLLPLIIDQRAPINVSIPGIQSAGNFVRVDTVDQAHVAAAKGSIIGTATATGLQAASRIFWHMETYDSQRQFGLSFAVSGKYLGFEASAGGSINRSASETTVSAHFYQQMYTVVVAPPSSPGGWFSSAFTTDKLQQQVSLGRIGADNLPVYVGEVVYGRMMMFSVTSTASASDIQAAINASYSTLTGSGSGSISTRQKKLLTESRIEIASVGGNDQATIAMIRSGDWSAYFTASAPLSTAEPLSYTFYNLADNSIASVSEATSYSVRTCAPASAGQFDMLPAQSFAAPVPTPFETRLGDVNHDGLADLVFNHRSANSNQVAVALGQAAGTFAAPGAPLSHTAMPVEGWAPYTLHTGDFDGDGNMDLLWSLADSVNNSYVALADGSGGWTLKPLQQQVKRNWAGYGLYVGDLDNDGDDDLVWNRTSAGPNWVYTALSNHDGTFALDTALQVVNSGGWSAYHTAIADLNHDGRADLIWNITSGTNTNRTYTALSLGTGQFGPLHGFYDHPTPCCWGAYQTLVADVNRDQVPDLLWFNGASSYLHKATGNGDGSITFRAGQDLKPAIGAGPFTGLAGDVDGDGASDLIVNRLTSSTNVIAVARGTTSGSMDPTVTPPQTHNVSTNWNGALPVLVGDVNYDGRADVVWVIPGSPPRVFVGRSRP